MTAAPRYRLVEQITGCAPYFLTLPGGKALTFEEAREALVRRMEFYDTFPQRSILDGVDGKSFDVWTHGQREVLCSMWEVENAL
jgi:hypothetical protein